MIRILIFGEKEELCLKIVEILEWVRFKHINKNNFVLEFRIISSEVAKHFLEILGNFLHTLLYVKIGTVLVECSSFFKTEASLIPFRSMLSTKDGSFKLCVSIKHELTFNDKLLVNLSRIEDSSAEVKLSFRMGVSLERKIFTLQEYFKESVVDAVTTIVSHVFLANTKEPDYSSSNNPILRNISLKLIREQFEGIERDVYCLTIPVCSGTSCGERAQQANSLISDALSGKKVSNSPLFDNGDSYQILHLKIIFK